MRRVVATVLLLAALVWAPSGCGGSTVDKATQELDQLREHIEQVLSSIPKVLPTASSTDSAGRSHGNTGPNTIGTFLDSVLASVDSYWKRTFAAEGLTGPTVKHDWVPPKDVVKTACGGPATPLSAFYCTGDDTIYIGQVFAADLWAGVLHGLPGESLGYGHAAGDFAVAYVVAHEYAHNVQAELGIYRVVRVAEAKPFELQADCLAGTWANSVYEQGLINTTDIQEALNTALAVGDFEVTSAQHHGTPEERANAFLTGFRSGRPSSCSLFLAAQ